MTVAANSYGTATGIERLVGDVFVSRTISSTTIPSLTYVEGMIDQTAADLNRELAAAGYATPISTGQADAYAWARSINEQGAAALVLGSMPMTSISPGREDAGNNRLALFSAAFNKALSDIKDHRLVATRSRGRLGAVFAGSQTDSDSQRKLPLFRRDQDSYPGSRSLTE